MTRHRLELKPDCDGFGFFYGGFYVGESRYRIDIMPPESEGRPYYVVRDAVKADPSLWTVYADGNEIGRVARREEVETLLVEKLVKTRGWRWLG